MLRKVTSIYSIVMGLSMISMWTMPYVTGIKAFIYEVCDE